MYSKCFKIGFGVGSVRGFFMGYGEFVDSEGFVNYCEGIFGWKEVWVICFEVRWEDVLVSRC